MEESFKFIANVFIGDTGDFYCYKSGPKIFEFFNKYFGYNDDYWNAKSRPSRWVMAYDKIVDLYNRGMINKFLSIILGINYLFVENRDLNKQQLMEKSTAILNEFNKELQVKGYEIVNKDGYRLIKIDDDLEFLGAGGFAEVYKSKSRNIVLKKLKEQFYLDEGVVSRFKREFSIMKKLQGKKGVLEVYSYDEKNLTYTMEIAEKDLSTYLKSSNFNFDIKIKIILQILNIIKEVHAEQIWHRDISPSNILIVKGQLKISDFGLGKDMTVFNSHQTSNTHGMGQYYYCDPKQFMRLKEGDKYSDIYSIGRVINFIMKGNPLDYEHEFKSVSEKATADSEMIRYKSIEELEGGINLILNALRDADFKRNSINKLQSYISDESVWLYLNGLDMNEVFFSLKENYFMHGYFNFISKGCSHEEGYNKLSLLFDECTHYSHKKFEDYDYVAYFAIEIIRDKSINILVREAAVEILNYVIKCNRFVIWNATKDLIASGIDDQLASKIDIKYINSHK